MLTKRKINILTHEPHRFCLVLHQVKQGGWAVLLLLQELEQFRSSWEKKNTGHILPLLIQWLEEDGDGLPHFSHLLLGVLLPRDSPVTGSWCTHTLPSHWLWSAAGTLGTLSAGIQASPGQTHSPSSAAKAASFSCLHEEHLGGWKSRVTSLGRQEVERKRWESYGRMLKGMCGTVWEG